MFDVLFDFDHIQEVCLWLWRFTNTLSLKICLLVKLVTIANWHLRLECGLHWDLTLISRLHRHLRLILILLLIWIIHRLLRHLGHIKIPTTLYIRRFLLFKLIAIKSFKLSHKIINIILFFLFFILLLSWHLSLPCIVWIIWIASWRLLSSF